MVLSMPIHLYRYGFAECSSVPRRASRPKQDRIIGRVADSRIRSSAEILSVDQRAFGYLKPGMEQKFLHTSFWPCIPVFLRSVDDKLSVLAHFDDMGLFSPARQAEMLNLFVKLNGLLMGQFDEIVVIEKVDGRVKSPKRVYNELVRRLENYATGTVEVIGRGCSDVVFDADGNLYWGSPRELGIEIPAVRGGFSMRSLKLRCENTGEAIDRDGIISLQ